MSMPDNCPKSISNLSQIIATWKGQMRYFWDTFALRYAYSNKQGQEKYNDKCDAEYNRKS